MAAWLSLTPDWIPPGTHTSTIQDVETRFDEC